MYEVTDVNRMYSRGPKEKTVTLSAAALENYLTRQIALAGSIIWLIAGLSKKCQSQSIMRLFFFFFFFTSLTAVSGSSQQLTKHNCQHHVPTCQVEFTNILPLTCQQLLPCNCFSSIPLDNGCFAWQKATFTWLQRTSLAR